jgi:carboxymethylenebutenolidase
LGKHFSLVASDSFKLGAYRAEPSGTAKGGIVVIQEIFGVNHHIRAVCDRFAGEGYVAVAPALFDRQHPDFECGYSPDEIANARKFVANPDWGAMMKDVQAAIDDAKQSGPTAIVGYCLGGTLAFLAGAKLNGL